MMATYKGLRQSIKDRLIAATAAMGFEKPRLAAVAGLLTPTSGGMHGQRLTTEQPLGVGAAAALKTHRHFSIAPNSSAGIGLRSHYF